MEQWLASFSLYEPIFSIAIANTNTIMWKKSEEMMSVAKGMDEKILNASGY